MVLLSFDHRLWKGAALLIVVLAICLFVLKNWVASGVLLFILASHVAFFRDPMRAIAQGAGLISAADGRVVQIEEFTEPPFLNTQGLKIGIFLSIFNVHVTRSPIAGVVRWIEYRPGKFLNALSVNAASANESNWIGIEDETGRRVVVRQMVGAIARRIFCDVKVGQKVEKGDKLGIICYGSRVEIYLPQKGFECLLKVGDEVRVGETEIGRWLS